MHRRGKSNTREGDGNFKSMMVARKRKNWLKILGFLILITVIVLGGFMIWKSFLEEKNWPGVEPVDNPGANIAVMDAKEDGKKDEENKKPDLGKEEIKQFDGEDPNNNKTITGAVTYAGVSNGSLIIRVNIDQYLKGGTCRLSLLKGGEIIYNSTAEIIDSAATATCKGFNVSTAELASGVVSIRIDVTSGEKTGTIEGEVSL